MKGTSFYEEQMGMAFDSIPCGLCIYQIADGQILSRFRNPAFYEILGYSDKRRSDDGWVLDLGRVHPEDAGPLKEKLSLLVRNKGKLQHTFRLFHDRENEYRWIRMEGSIRQLEHGETMLYGAFSDVSSQVRLEKELAGANAKMETSSMQFPAVWPSTGCRIYLKPSIFRMVFRNCQAIPWRSTGSWSKEMQRK